jgi:hypothetical protein
MLIGLSIVATVYSISQGKGSWVLYLSAAFILTFEHFKGGSIWLAFQAYRKQDFDKVRKYIDATPNPDWLRPSSKAYYLFLSGVIATMDNDFKNAKALFVMAVNGNLRTDHLKCATYCILADTSLRLNELDDAKKYFEKAKRTSHRDELNPVFDDLKNRIAEIA